AGRALPEVAAELRARLLEAGLVRDVASNVRLQLAAASSITVSVEGAVFAPGFVAAGERTDPGRLAVVDHPAMGDYLGNRTLTGAIRSASGIRPDASVQAIYLLRGPTYAVIDETTAMTGGVLMDPQLAAGDRVVVLSVGCFQPDLVKPTALTQPGIRVFMSNLTRPAASNSASAIGKDTTSLPYGTRFLQALVTANCVGGAMINAQRHAVLISRNPFNGHSVVIQRSIEQLVRDANRDDIDPYLMPNDALACYDSTGESIADVINLLGNLATPAALVKSLSN
ncbi:MAG TPA: polysaccharide biosynthesis protein, partial [Novosphingobium sp.]|nr:polysaccharide biosynthesis protein [Novosphingobium sp.]